MERTLSSAAKAAKQIRKELKETFPNVKFSVRVKSGSIYISWTDWPVEPAVEEIVDKYEEIQRDEYGEVLAGGNMFVFCNNVWSDEVRAEIVANMPEVDDSIYYFWFRSTANRLYLEKYRAIVTAPKQK
jgi:hypothetical protein